MVVKILRFAARNEKKKTTHELLKHLTMLSRKKFHNTHYHFETIKIKYHSLPYFVSNKKKAKT